MGAAQQSRRNLDLAVASVFLLACLVRLWLAIVNREANDDHIEVVLRLLAGDPVVRDACWECGQPLLFHRTVALLGSSLRLTDREHLTVIAQLVNAMVGVFTLLTLSTVLRPRLSVHRLALFSVVALNPALVGIHAQATNDALVIGLSVVGSLFIFRWLAAPLRSRGSLAGGVACLALMPLAKGNGVVFALALLLAVAVVAWARRSFRTAAFCLCMFAGVGLIAALFGPYARDYHQYGTPFRQNSDKGPPPSLLQLSEHRRPGIRSVADGFMTFRVAALLEQPSMGVGAAYPLHRTSFWTLMYARSLGVRIVRFPRTWIRDDARLDHLYRATALVGLMPLVLLTAFSAGRSRRVLRAVLPLLETAAPLRAYARSPALVFVALGAAAVTFQLKYAYDYRDFEFMKPIFVFPAFASFAFVLRGCDVWLAKHDHQQRWSWRWAMTLSCTLLTLLHLADVVWLAVDLTRAG